MAHGDFAAGSDGGFNPSTFLAHSLDAQGGFARGPERALLSALLFDGVQSYMNFITATNEHQRGKYKEAYNWVVRQSDDYVFSFGNVCHALGIDPEFFRRGLLQAKNSDAFEWGNARRNF